MNPLERLKEIASAFGFAGGGGEDAWFDSSNPVCRDAEKLLRAGRAAEAEEIFHKVLTDPRYSALAKKHLPRILLALAAAQLQQQKWEAAEQSAARAWALLSDPRYRSSPEFAECCRLRAQAARGRGALEDALRLYLQGLAAVEGQKQPKAKEIVERRLEVSALLRQMGRNEEAERMSAEAVRVAAEKLPGARQHGDACLEWALCLAECGQFEQAREAGEQAAALHRAACGDHSDELALDYEKLGSICQKQEDFPAAVSYLEKALGIRERQVGGDTSELALLMVALADLYTLIGRLAPALELLQQAVGKLGPSKDCNLAAALEKLGSVYTRTGRYEDAAGCYQRAYDFWAASPEDYADRITANRQALESLLPWLPEPPAPPPKPETPDSGISVLREHHPGKTTAVPKPAMPGLPVLPVTPQPPPAALSSVSMPQAEPLPAPSFEPGSPPALPGVLIADQPAPSVQAPMPAAHFALMQPAPAPLGPAPITGFPAHAPGPGIARPPAALPAQPAQPAAVAPPALPAQEALHALCAAVPPRQDAYGFHGWEDLEFDKILR